ncbi:transposase InsO family protein/transposase-like protein [Rhodococcus sp. OAS809]|uniref:IS3 family transposase n=1 Tax=Rhodococcus sp. OAS809 TaxID=2663874 RepID=UPI001789F6D3
MSRKRRSFTTEYKVEAARRVIDSDRTIAEIARELGINEALLGRWVAYERRRIEATAASGDQPLTTAERTELAWLRRQVSAQEKDIAFLKKRPRISRPINKNRALRVDVRAECANSAIHRMARLLEVSTSGFYKHQGRSVTTRLDERQRRRTDLEMKLLAIHRESKGVYGSPRITAELRDGGEVVTATTVVKIMRSVGSSGCPQALRAGRYPRPRTFKVRTTVFDPFASFPEDLVQRRFDQGCLDAVWTSDITYLTCGEDDMYLCAIKDEHSKKSSGGRWPITLRSELVLDALDMAVAERGGDVTGTIMHSDKGTQFTAGIMKQACERYRLRRSMGETGICWDNAGAES